MLEEQGKIKEEDKMPKLGEDQFYLECFSDLCTERSIGMDLGSIPFSAILRYQQYFNLNSDFLDIILRIDREYLNNRNKKQDRDKKNGGRKKN